MTLFEKQNGWSINVRLPRHWSEVEKIVIWFFRVLVVIFLFFGNITIRSVVNKLDQRYELKTDAAIRQSNQRLNDLEQDKHLAEYIAEHKKWSDTVLGEIHSGLDKNAIQLQLVLQRTSWIEGRMDKDNQRSKIQ